MELFALKMADVLMPDMNVDDENDDLFASAIETKNDEKPNMKLETEEIDLNSEDDVYKNGFSNASPKLEMRTEPEDIFEDAPESKEQMITIASIPPSLPVNTINSQETKSSLKEERKDVIAKLPEEVNDKYIHITVKDPQKVGDGMLSYLTYCITTRTNIGLFKKKELHVVRRFSDFLGLHEKLVEKYLHKGTLVPAPPEKDVVGMTKVKMTSSQPEQESKLPEFVERRRAALERYLNRTAAHPVLQADPDFREFLESETELPRASNTSALSGAGVLRLFNKVGEKVTKIAFKMGESDPWFEERLHQLETMESQLRRLQDSLDGLCNHRRELACATAALGRGLALLSNGEDHTALSRALAKMADLQDKLEAVHNDQASADFYFIHELLKDYVALLGVVKDVFHERVKTFQTWQHAQQMLTKKREAAYKLEAAGRPDKVTPAKDEVLEWEAKVNRSQEEFEAISTAIKRELERFELQRVKDFKEAFVLYLEAQLQAQEKIIEHWESYMPEAKAIA